MSDEELQRKLQRIESQSLEDFRLTMTGMAGLRDALRGGLGSVGESLRVVGEEISQAFDRVLRVIDERTAAIDAKFDIVDQALQKTSDTYQQMFGLLHQAIEDQKDLTPRSEFTDLVRRVDVIERRLDTG